MTISPDGKILASGGSDATIKLWNLHTFGLMKTLFGHVGWVISVIFGPDGTTLASGSEDNTIKLWNLHTFGLVKTLLGHGGCIR